VRNRRLPLSKETETCVTKTTSTAFHPNNKETMRQLAVNVQGNTLPYNPNPTYLGVKLDRQLTYKQHVQGLCQNILTRNNLLRCLAGSSWGVSRPTIRTAALAIAFSAAEYAAPVWCRSCHSKNLDVALNDTLRLYYWVFASHPNQAIVDSGRHCTTKPAQGTAYI